MRKEQITPLSIDRAAFGLPPTDLRFDYPSQPTPTGAKPKRCGRHDWTVRIVTVEPGLLAGIYGEWVCSRCGKTKDEQAAQRGKNNLSRGNAIEREIGHRLGLRRVGQYGGPDDLSGDLFAVQVKSGGSFSERYWSWLRAVPANAGQTPLLVVTDAPGPGHRRRAMVVLTLADWIALHGPEGSDA
jgi:hypothetical protein